MKMIEKSELVEILKRTLLPQVLLFDLLALLLIFLSGVSVCFGLLSIGWTEEAVSYVAIGLTVVLIPSVVLIRERFQRVDPLKMDHPPLVENRSMESTQMDRRQLFAHTKRVVVKVGTSTIAQKFDFNAKRLDGLVGNLATMKGQGKEVILVTSGAIVAGTGKLGFTHRPQTLPELQAAAAVGQSWLMHAYESRFQQYHLTTAMMLLTQEDFNHRGRYIHISNTLRTLLRLNVIPIINENDTVAVEEIKFGDNDTLAAYVTNLAEADLLIILSDQDGFYTADPRKDPNAKLISRVPNITEEMKRSAGSTALPRAPSLTRIGSSWPFRGGARRSADGMS